MRRKNKFFGSYVDLRYFGDVSRIWLKNTRIWGVDLEFQIYGRSWTFGQKTLRSKAERPSNETKFEPVMLCSVLIESVRLDSQKNHRK